MKMYEFETWLHDEPYTRCKEHEIIGETDSYYRCEHFSVSKSDVESGKMKSPFNDACFLTFVAADSYEDARSKATMAFSRYFIKMLESIEKKE